MDAAMVNQVRRFNRTVTQRVGALDDHFLSLDRPLGEARLLWEIGPEGRDVRSLRSRLELDSGYLSRLLRSLETAGMVEVVEGTSDRRVRHARLTPAGLAERELLEQRSDGLAESLLAPLDPAQQERLVAAMGDVERLLTAAIVEIATVDPEHPDARQCVGSYFAELDRRSEPGLDSSDALPAEPHELRPPAGRFLVAYLRSEPIGCGGVKHLAGATSEIKRMWVAEQARGLGLGRRLLSELEACASRAGARKMRLDTNRSLTEAIAMYRSGGYAEVPAFNDEPFAHHWFEKTLPA
jgi:DNA-binding MarR family transcriptional regulator/predicted GNAT family N-acyltransferase